MKVYNSPKLVQRLLSRFTWKIPGEEKVIYLTFDDGPHHDITIWVLEQLELYNAKGTFFCIGKNIEKNPDVFNEITKKGHTIGNHTYSHVNGWKTPFKKYMRDVFKCNNHCNTNLFRPPYGKIDLNQGAALLRKGYKIIMWSVLTYDYDVKLNREESLQNIKNSSPGNIIVFHDSQKAKENLQYLLPKTLAHFNNKGWQFKALPATN